MSDQPAHEHRHPVTPRRVRWLAVAAVVAVCAVVAVFLLSRRSKPTSSGPVETEVPVHTAKVVRTSVRRYVDSFGSVAPEPAHEGQLAASTRLASPTAGVVAKTLCFEGQHIDKDAVLFELDDRAALADEQKAEATSALSQSKIKQTLATAAFAHSEADRAQTLFDQGLGSQKDLAAAELTAKTSDALVAEAKAAAVEAQKGVVAARARRTLFTIKSPIAGTIVRVGVNAGESVDATTILAEIVDLDRLVVAATVPAIELPSLKIDQPVELYAARRGDEVVAKEGPQPVEEKAYAGKLVFIGYDVDRKTDSVMVRVSIDPQLGLRPGQYLRLRLVVDEHRDRLAVPANSVTTDGGPAISVVVDGRAKRRPVSIGFSEAGLTEVAGEGVVEGMTVVTAGAYGLPDGTRVRLLEGP